MLKRSRAFLAWSVLGLLLALLLWLAMVMRTRRHFSSV
jgi:hypothetical protein